MRLDFCLGRPVSGRLERIRFTRIVMEKVLVALASPGPQTASHTVPTGLSGLPPSGPAIPLVDK